MECHKQVLFPLKKCVLESSFLPPDESIFSSRIYLHYHQSRRSDLKLIQRCPNNLAVVVRSLSGDNKTLFGVRAAAAASSGAQQLGNKYGKNLLEQGSVDP